MKPATRTSRRTETIAESHNGNTLNPPTPIAIESRALIPVPAGIAAAVIALAAWYLNVVVSWRQAALFLVGAGAGVVLYHAAFGFTIC